MFNGNEVDEGPSSHVQLVRQRERRKLQCRRGAQRPTTCGEEAAGGGLPSSPSDRELALKGVVWPRLSWWQSKNQGSVAVKSGC